VTGSTGLVVEDNMVSTGELSAAMSEELRVLVAEDSEDDTLLILRELRRAGYETAHQRVDTPDELIAALDGREWDAIIADYFMPQFSGLAALQIYTDRDLDIPFIVVSDKAGEETAVEVMRAGAHDYILKDSLTRLAPAIKRELRQAQIRKERRKDIVEYQERLRSLISELTLSEERQRRHIATELHDGIAQKLTGCILMLGLLNEKVDAPEVAVQLERVQDTVKDMIQDTRNLMSQLSPIVLYDLGLEAGIRWLGERMRDEHGLQVDVQCEDSFERMAEDIKVTLFQSVRELLMNVVKHAQAEQTNISMDTQNGVAYITVEDRGGGFDLSQQPLQSHAPGGFGLFSIRERVTYLGGRVDIDTAPGRGTRITLVVPFESR